MASNLEGLAKHLQGGRPLAPNVIERIFIIIESCIYVYSCVFVKIESRPLKFSYRE